MGVRHGPFSETPCRLPARGTLSADEHVEEQHRLSAEAAFDTPQRIDFTHPDFAMMCSRSGLRAGAYSWFYTSFDRCQSWKGPFRLPMFDYTGIAARTDYLVSSPDECLLFLTASKADGEEGLIFCAQTTDGGESFSLLSQIGPGARRIRNYARECSVIRFKDSGGGSLPRRRGFPIRLGEMGELDRSLRLRRIADRRGIT